MAQETMRPDLYPELYQVENRHWWHQQKRQVVHQLIQRYCPRPGKVLDVGCGAGKLLAELKPLGWQVEGVDLVVTQGRRRGLNLKQVNLQTQPLPFAKNQFDLVVCLDTLEHMADDRRLTAEMARVAKPGGTVIISVPAYPWLFSYWDKMLGHYRRYTKKTLLRATVHSGLKLKFSSYFFSFLLLPAILVRLLKTILRQKHRSDFITDPLPVFTHGLVGIFGGWERLWLQRFSIPFGLSLVGVFEKK
jgi:SAM-dependent methyltransferase